MERDVRLLSAVGASGIVMGALDATGHIDLGLMERLIGAARPLNVTFHRVIDAVPSISSGLESLVELGVDRVLTSGGQATAEDGVDTIAALVRQARGRIVVMAGGGVRAHNVANLVRATGITEVHARLLSDASSPSTWPEHVRSFVAALDSLS
jgi:copper homeostasis protein